MINFFLHVYLCLYHLWQNIIILAVINAKKCKENDKGIKKVYIYI